MSISPFECIHQLKGIKVNLFSSFSLGFTFQKKNFPIFYPFQNLMWIKYLSIAKQQNRKFIKSGKSWNPLKSQNRFRLASVSRLPSRAIWPRARLERSIFSSILLTKNNSKLLLVVWLCDSRDFLDFHEIFTWNCEALENETARHALCRRSTHKYTLEIKEIIILLMTKLCPMRRKIIRSLGEVDWKEIKVRKGTKGKILCRRALLALLHNNDDVTVNKFSASQLLSVRH